MNCYFMIYGQNAECPFGRRADQAIQLHIFLMGLYLKEIGLKKESCKSNCMKMDNYYLCIFRVSLCLKVLFIL